MSLLKEYIRKHTLVYLKEQDELPTTPENAGVEGEFVYPMDFLLNKFSSLNKTMKDLMTPSFKEYVKNISVVAPKPTTFKIELKNGQYFHLIYDPKSYRAKVSGKKYYLINIGEEERAIQAIADLLIMGIIPKTDGPSTQTDSKPNNTAKSTPTNVDIPTDAELSNLEDIPDEPEESEESKDKPPVNGEPPTEPQQLKEYIKGIVMNMLLENEETDNARFREERPITVKFGSKQDMDAAIEAISDPTKYGRFATQFLKFDTKLNKAFIDEFGPSIPLLKKAAEKKREIPFPIKTQQSVIDFISKYYSGQSNNKGLFDVKKDVQSNTITIPLQDFLTKEAIIKVVKTVLDSLKIKYSFK